VFSKIRELSKNITVYGLGDVAVSVINFFLLPIYAVYFSPADYGIIGILGVIEVGAKIAFRFGLDGSFMRFFYDCRDDRDRRTLASTIFFFLFALNGVLMLLLLLAAPWIAAHLLGDRIYSAALRLMLVNMFAVGFTFIPFHVLRMERRTTTFSLLTLVRSVLTIAVRLLLVMRLGMGVTGLYLADVLVTIVIMAALLRWFSRLIGGFFSRRVLRETLSFGLPRVPHSAAQQIIAVGDKILLRVLDTSGSAVHALQTVGIYSLGVSFGLTQKLFLSAFESAWAPFYYATVKERDAPRVFRMVTTYGVAVLALLTAGLSAAGADALKAMTHGRQLAPSDPLWRDVSIVIAFTALGVFFQGIYLLTSIGLNITKETRYYPVATISAAAVNIGLNLVLIPPFGMRGAAWANGVAYAVQAALGYRFSQRFYPIAYEWGRIARVCTAAIAAYVAAALLPHISIAVDPRSVMASVPDVLVRGTVVVAVFAALLAATGFFHADEIAQLRRLRRRGPPAPTQRAVDSTEMAGEIVATDIERPE
jgi:O-antigen/teichoic acid export membrane protein